MVHKAFREALGETATQAGSENAPGRFRFDFPANGSVPPSVLADVESRVNSLLLENLHVTAQTMTQPEAKAMGAMALFGEKYGDQVRVVSVGDWAHELCGGTHVSASGQLGVVKLLSESSIGAGVRRVEALVGFDAYNYLAREHVLLGSLTEIIKGSRVEELPERISDLVGKMKSIEKELSQFRAQAVMASASKLKDSVQVVGGFNVIAAAIDVEASAEDLRSLALDLRNRVSDAVVVLTSAGREKVTLVVSVSDIAQKAGIKAGDLVKIGSTVLGGGGGGKPDFAQGGGSDASKISLALEEIVKNIAALGK
jgi:alanyl-tRNA synthetase